MSTDSPSFMIGAPSPNYSTNSPSFGTPEMLLMKSQPNLPLTSQLLLMPTIQQQTFLPLVAATELFSVPGNLQRFLQVTTPMIVRKFDREGTESSPTISQLFGGITQVSAKGLKFEFREESQVKADSLFRNICDNSTDEEVLVYTPVLSLFKLRFRKQLHLPKIQFEASGDSMFNDLTPSGVIRAKLPQ